MLTKTVIRKELNICIDNQDLLFMNILLLFEEIDDFFIGLGSTKLLDQIDKNKFEDFLDKRFIHGEINFDFY
jgi:hypothetical protein